MMRGKAKKEEGMVYGRKACDDSLAIKKLIPSLTFAYSPMGSPRKKILERRQKSLTNCSYVVNTLLTENAKYEQFVNEISLFGCYT